jgi:hypothetical protein
MSSACRWNESRKFLPVRASARIRFRITGGTGAVRSDIFNPKTAEEARESRENPRMAGTSNRRSPPDFFRVNFPHLPLFIRVHWLYSRAKSGSGFNGRHSGRPSIWKFILADALAAAARQPNTVPWASWPYAQNIFRATGLARRSVTFRKARPKPSARCAGERRVCR